MNLEKEKNLLKLSRISDWKNTARGCPSQIESRQIHNLFFFFSLEYKEKKQYTILSSTKHR
jgi:hypothetical protein